MWGNACASGSSTPADWGESGGETRPLPIFHLPTHTHSATSPHLLHTRRVRRGAVPATALFIACSAGSFQEALQAFDGGAEGGILAHPPLDDLGSVNDRGVVAPAEAVADDGERRVGVAPAQIHRQLARQRHRAGAFLRSQIVRADAEEVANRLLNRLDVRRLDVGDEAPFETIAQSLLEVGDLLRELVGGEDDLVVAFVERVEGVEKLLLRALPAGEELYVIDDQHVDAPEAALELVHAIAT